MFNRRLTRISLVLIAASALAAPLSLSSSAQIGHAIPSLPLSAFDTHVVTPEVKVVEFYPPTFIPAGGTYAAPQTVKMVDAAVGAVFYYTTNGATPTTASTRYTGPISVSKTETVRAIAVASGRASGVATVAYTIK
jgi:hypothetical protein